MKVALYARVSSEAQEARGTIGSQLEVLRARVAAEDHPEELVSDDPESDTPDDDEPELPEPAEEAALHTVDENESPVDEDADLDAEGNEPDKR